MNPKCIQQVLDSLQNPEDQRLVKKLLFKKKTNEELPQVFLDMAPNTLLEDVSAQEGSQDFSLETVVEQPQDTFILHVDEGHPAFAAFQGTYH